MTLKTSKLLLSLTLVAFLFSGSVARAQKDLSSMFTKFKLEARADFDFLDKEVNNQPKNQYGLRGRYFNLMIGGDLNDQFSYYFKQRIIAKPGTVNLFDNTDFLYLNYKPTQNWQFRLGKDALAVGGFEYDAPPIDVLFSTEYWDNFYCFQPAVSAAYITNDGNHTIMFQVANSPYVHYGNAALGSLGDEWGSGRLCYNLYWSGNFGHFKTFYSYNLFECTEKDYLLNYVALGNKLVYEDWDWYLDLMHHSLGNDDFMKNYAVVSCFNFHATKNLNLFAKCAYEQNQSPIDLNYFGTFGSSLDCFVQAGHNYWIYGAGFEYRPEKCQAVRFHGFVSNKTDEDANTGITNSTLDFNLGVTWDMDMLKLCRK